MALINAFTLIRAISLFHLTAAYYFITAPQKLAEQNFVVLIGQSMQKPASTDFLGPNQATALVGLILAFASASDLLAASMLRLTAIEYWSSQVPVRLAMLFGLAGYIYVIDAPDALARMASVRSRSRMGSAGELIRTDLTFTIAFLEMCLWFWVYLLLREERKGIAAKLVEMRRFEEENRL